MAAETSATLRVALVGVGQIVQSLHVPALAILGHRIAFAADPSERALAALRQLVPAPFTAAVTADPKIPSEIDAVLVASPTGLHAAQVRRFLTAGHSVFCEKPLACHAAEAEALAELARKQRQVLQLGYFRRHYPSLQQLGTWLRSEFYGPAQRISIRAGHIASNIPESFLVPSLAGGGVLIDFGVHVFDLLAGWFDDLRLDAYADDAHPNGIEANACARLTGRIADRSVPIVVELSRTSPLGYFLDLEFARATVRAELNGGNELCLRPKAPPGQPLRILVSAPHDTIYYFVREWLEFSRRLGGEPERVHSLRDAVRATELAETCYAIRRSFAPPWGG